MKVPSYVVETEAYFSNDEIYRYYLGRYFKPKKEGVLDEYLYWIMLNPSTATKNEDDRSVRKCTEIAKRLDYDGCVILNLFALRSTDPNELYKHPKPIGEFNDLYLLLITSIPVTIVCAWGNHGLFQDRYKKIINLIKESQVDLKVKCIGKNKSGMPKHPLYARTDSLLQDYPYMELG